VQGSLHHFPAGGRDRTFLIRAIFEKTTFIWGCNSMSQAVSAENNFLTPTTAGQNRGRPQFSARKHFVWGPGGTEISFFQIFFRGGGRFFPTF